MTAAERVAILDRQLEESTRDFDGIIYDEEQRQREAARDRAAQTAQTGGGGSEPNDAEEPTFGGGMASAGGGSAAAVSAAAVAHHPPMAPSILHHPTSPMATMTTWCPPVARGGDAGTRPAVRDKLWQEYRKYKGIEEPDYDAPDLPSRSAWRSCQVRLRDREVDLGTVLDTPTTSPRRRNCSMLGW